MEYRDSGIVVGMFTQWLLTKGAKGRSHERVAFRAGVIP